MAIINTPSTLTTAQKQAKAKATINGGVNALYRQMLTTYNSAMESVWANADGLTPQEVFNAFGTNGGELVRLATLLKTTINTATPNTIPDSSVSLTVNNDGTVTVG
jgi:hypothetical protein